MYTESSIELKSDFYCRYGSAALQLYFERTGLPCVILDSGSERLAFAMGLGVRAYGRECGDILRIINADSNECDVTFAPHGLGAQILYKEDMPGMDLMRETAEYTILKLLCAMRHVREPGMGGIVEMCDRFGSRGWCAYDDGEIVRQVPLPLVYNNVILVRTGKKHRDTAAGGYERFCEGERLRIEYAARALRACRTDLFFEAVNESELSIERLLSPPQASVEAVHDVMEADGVLAARICDPGIICITEKDKTDSVIQSISHSFESRTGYPAGIIVVK